MGGGQTILQMISCEGVVSNLDPVVWRGLEKSVSWGVLYTLPLMSTLVPRDYLAGQLGHQNYEPEINNYAENIILSCALWATCQCWDDSSH